MGTNRIIITQSNYIPWKGYFDAIAACDCFVIYDDVQYTRRDWRNRNIINTKNGLQWLTIPVEVKGKFSQKINETRVADKNWNLKHLQILKNEYKKAAYYSDVKDWVETLYLNCKFDFLSEINQYFLENILSYLKIKVEIKKAETFDASQDRTLRLVDICEQLSAKEYYTGSAAKKYLSEAEFIKKNITVKYIDYDGYAEYEQLGSKFEHKVSVIDLIFNKGERSTQYLKNVK
jgi:hypothetical protein